MMDLNKMQAASFQANEHLALSTLQTMPVFQAFKDMDFQRLLELMQEPVRNIDNVIGKAQMKTICKQVLAQNLALQTTVRNLQIESKVSSEEFESAMDQLDTAVRKHTEFEGIEDLMMREAAQQEVAEAQGQLDLETSEAAHADAVTAELGHGTFKAGPVDTDGYANATQAAAGGMTQKPMEH